MNKRIKELAEQAGITTNLDTDYFEKDINKWVDYYSEKFAELIVWECAELCSTNEMSVEQFGEKSYRLGRHFNVMIREHFGVEE